MPLLNWGSQSSVQAQTLSHPRYQTQLSLSIGASDRDELVQLLEEVFAQPGSELRLELPLRWTIYWKVREGDSRLLLAHPDHETWVASVSLNEMHASRLLTALRELTPAQTFQFTEMKNLGQWSSVGNLEIQLVLT